MLDSSASFASAMLLSQEFTHRSGTFVTDIPPEQFGEKKPSFNLLLLRIADCFRPMPTSRECRNRATAPGPTCAKSLRQILQESSIPDRGSKTSPGKKGGERRIRT